MVPPSAVGWIWDSFGKIWLLDKSTKIDLSQHLLIVFPSLTLKKTLPRKSWKYIAYIAIGITLETFFAFHLGWLRLLSGRSRTFAGGSWKWTFVGWLCPTEKKTNKPVVFITLQGINIFPKNGILKMIFLFLRWDMLVPWRVIMGWSHYSKICSWLMGGCDLSLSFWWLGPRSRTGLFCAFAAR